MTAKTTITFLGTGGGRHVTASQLLQTGGFVIRYGDSQIVCDPGPGHLVHANRNKIRPQETDIVFVSHTHVDHSSDFSALIDAITEGKKYSRGTFICPSEVRTSELNSFHQTAGERFIDCDTISQYTHRNVHFEFFRLDHPGSCYGFRLRTPTCTIGYIADTEYFESLHKTIKGCDIVIINMTAPHFKQFKGHLNTTDVIDILSQLTAKPRQVILTHRGIALTDPTICDAELSLIRQKHSIDVCFAHDNTTVDTETGHWS